VLSRLGALAALLLILGQPMAALAGGWEAGTPDHDDVPETEQTQSPRHAPDTDISIRHYAEKSPALSPPDIDSVHYYPHLPEPARYLPSCGGPISDISFPQVPMQEPLLGPVRLRSGLSTEESLTPVVHRGELRLDEISPSLAAPLLSSGPNTPPPSSGNWIIDNPGNKEDNTTILLNGHLNVTAGDLTLDNVTLIVNCISDGQYGINVSAGSTLNLTNTIITAFNGSLHYKFTVFGNMTMDGCNVSEMWGDSERY